GAGRARGFHAERRRNLPRGLGFALEVAEPVLLREAARGRGRRLGGGGEAVPAPEVAFERNQPLPGLEFMREPLSIGPSDISDLRQPAREGGRRGDALAKRVDARWQRRVVAGRLDQRPMGWRR